MTLGTFVAFTAYQMRLIGPIQGLMGIYTSMATARASLSRVHALLDAEPDVRETANPIGLATSQGNLSFRSVRFGFGRGGPVLDGVDLDVPAGQTVAVVGASGSGKSTLADLLTRQIDADAGSVHLDGNDLRSLSLADVRRHIGIVEQDPFIFHASVAENVRYAKPSASDDEVWAALACAGLDRLVASMPEGLSSVVGERGKQLSAGERQRLAIARAFLADPSVIVLDEATGALDPRSEATVMRGYESLLHGRTVVLITHRRELARQAERVVVIEGGKIVDDGAPKDLEAAVDGAFNDLFRGALVV
jgi:ATP-binding cassette subfamily B protein